MKGFQTANQIIDTALGELRDFERKYYAEAAMYFVKGFREFRLFHDTGSIKEAWCTITPVNTVNYPEDAMKVISVGVAVDKELFEFTRADDMINPITSPIDEILSANEDNTLRRTQGGYGTQGVNVEYYYKDDKEKRRIVLGRAAVDITRFSARTEVLVRYISTGLEDFESTFISNDAVNLLVAYVVYQMVKSRPDKYDRAYRYEMKETYIEQRNMFDFLSLPTLDELADAIYETSGQTVRRI